jgi:hypothetical protein
MLRAGLGAQGVGGARGRGGQVHGHAALGPPHRLHLHPRPRRHRSSQPPIHTHNTVILLRMVLLCTEILHHRSPKSVLLPIEEATTAPARPPSRRAASRPSGRCGGAGRRAGWSRPVTALPARPTLAGPRPWRRRGGRIAAGRQPRSPCTLLPGQRIVAVSMNTATMPRQGVAQGATLRVQRHGR